MKKELRERSLEIVSEVSVAISILARDGKIWILLKLRHNDKIWLINQIKVIY